MVAREAIRLFACSCGVLECTAEEDEDKDKGMELSEAISQHDAPDRDEWGAKLPEHGEGPRMSRDVEGLSPSPDVGVAKA